MVTVEPILNYPAAVATLPGRRLLLIADYHAGFEAALRYERGFELPSRAPDRKDRLLSLIDEVNPDRVVVLGDLVHSIGGPKGAEQAELELLFEAIGPPVTVVKGNHDGIIEEFLAADERTFGGIEVTDTDGVRWGALGLAHGHTWPDRDVLNAEILCIGHEHPSVRLTDEVGGSRIERVWLRGPLVSEPFAERWEHVETVPELIVFPAFNELCGGTWVNVREQSFLAPFLPDALPDGTVYLLDGTQLGSYTTL